MEECKTQVGAVLARVSNNVDLFSSIGSGNYMTLFAWCILKLHRLKVASTKRFSQLNVAHTWSEKIA